MKKIIVSGIVIIVFALYAIFYHKSATSLPATTGESNSGAGATSATVTSGKVTPATSGQYKDGEYTGSSANAYYGTIQVKATIQEGKIADVQFLQYPHDQDTSIQVNKAAMPQLKQEAIAAQSANVDIVSGATQTSQAFKESLADALTQAS